MIHNTSDNAPTASIPVTLITGSLGAGKTTLLRQLLAPSHGLKIAVIENEFADIGIDDQLLGDSAVTTVTLAGGCICCSIGTDLERALVTLHERLAAGELQFDRLVIECSGMADPGPIAQLFLSEALLQEYYELDGILTLVDAVNAEQQLSRPLTQAQVGFADKLIVTKRDLVEVEVINRLAQRLARINRRAPIVFADHGRVPLNELVGLRAFELESDPAQLVINGPIHGALQPYALGHADAHHEHEKDNISTLVLDSVYPLDLDSLSVFMNELLEDHGHQLLRYKGVLDIEGANERLVFQGVFRMYNFDWDRPWGDEPRRSIAVFIGEHLPEDKIREGFLRATERRLV